MIYKVIVSDVKIPTPPKKKSTNIVSLWTDGIYHYFLNLLNNNNNNKSLEKKNKLCLIKIIIGCSPVHYG